MPDLGTPDDNMCRATSPGPGEPGFADELIARLAARQHGVVAAFQLLESGLTRRQIAYRVQRSRLRELYPGVYATGHGPLPLRARWMAAVLACGRGALLSHYDAGALDGLLRARGRRVHVTVGRSRRPRAAGLVVHRSSTILERDRTAVDGIPVTALPRTLLDLAEVVDGETLDRALEEADKENKLELGSVEELLARSPGRRGARPLRAALAVYRVEPEDIRSELERRFRSLCRAFGLPAASTNVWVEGFLVDAFWPSARLVVEIDSFEHHATGPRSSGTALATWSCASPGTRCSGSRTGSWSTIPPRSHAQWPGCSLHPALRPTLTFSVSSHSALPCCGRGGTERRIERCRGRTRTGHAGLARTPQKEAAACQF